MEIDEEKRILEGRIANIDIAIKKYKRKKFIHFSLLTSAVIIVLGFLFFYFVYTPQIPFISETIGKLKSQSIGIISAQGSQTEYADPNGDNSIGDWMSTGEFYYTEIDEGTRQPTTPNTEDYIYIDFFSALYDVDADFDMETFDLNGADITSIKIWAYGETYALGDLCTVHANIFVNSNWQTQQLIMDSNSAEGWYSANFIGNWNQNDLDNLRVRLRGNKEDNPDYIYVYAMYAEVNYTDITPPTITFNFKIPADITSVNLFGVNLTVSYNISDNSGINLSTVRLYHKTNSSYLDGSIYINGTLTEGWMEDANFLNDSISFNWSDTEAHVYPGTHNFDAEDMWYEPHSIQALPKDNYLKIRFFNVSNTSSYGIFEIMINSSENKNALIYYCNSSYESGSLNNPNCHNFYTLIPGTGFNHSHSEYSSHKLIPLAITDGGINGVRVTETSYMAIKGEAGWNVYYINNISREDTIQYSDDKGASFSNFSGTVDAHLHQYNGNAFHYFAGACDLLGNCGNSTVGKDLIVLDGLPPTSPYVYSPVNQTYYNNENININYTASVSPSGYDIVSYNISLLNSDETFNLTITDNNYPDLGYIWNISSMVNGSYIVKVEGCDNQIQCSFGLSEEFSIIEYVPPPPVQLCNWAVWKGAGDYLNLTNMGVMLCFNSSIGSFIWGRHEDSTCYKKVIATNQIINTTCPSG